jgi:hypothetical protein
MYTFCFLQGGVLWASTHVIRQMAESKCHVPCVGNITYAAGSLGRDDEKGRNHSQAGWPYLLRPLHELFSVR